MTVSVSLEFDPSGWVGATWSQIAVFQQEVTTDDVIEVFEHTQAVQVKHHSYHPIQIDQLRADAVEMGAPLVEYEQALADWVASYVPPPEPISVPQVVTRRQARRALAIFGVLDAVQVALDAIPDDTARTLAQIDWADATEFKRDDETLQMLAGALGLSEKQLDDLFILAGEQP